MPPLDRPRPTRGYGIPSVGKSLGPTRLRLVHITAFAVRALPVAPGGLQTLTAFTRVAARLRRHRRQWLVDVQ